MADGFRRWFSFGEDDQHIGVSNSHAAFIFKLFAESRYPHEPLGACARVTNRQPEMPYCAERKWNLHIRFLLTVK